MVGNIMGCLPRGDCWNVWQLSSRWAASARQVACFEAQPRVILQQLEDMLAFVYMWRHRHRPTQLQFYFHLTQQLHPRSLVPVLGRLQVSLAMVSCFLCHSLIASSEQTQRVSCRARSCQAAGFSSSWGLAMILIPGRTWTLTQDRSHFWPSECMIDRPWSSPLPFVQAEAPQLLHPRKCCSS